ncbi:topoisomerase [Salidesulfovibrio onnuriiensis]|uniref:topoisomerase n=1 Tax=Salidesulfovibrio onnuriiensis TaxID=2583823 RepID=UPI0011CA06D5|nr:topoisomerase [Salidesulfovibrio onnuriiensis]
MAKRDPNKTARNKRVKELKEQRRDLLGQVLKDTGIETEQSLNAIIGSKNDTYFDLKHDVISSAEEFIKRWISELVRHAKTEGSSNRILTLAQNHDSFKQYLLNFLEGSFYKHYDELYRVRPTVDKATLWIGQERANYGLLVTPRFKNGQWENDKSEIRAFKKEYWTIGHILETGLVVPGDEERITFSSVDNYLAFFKSTLVRASGSPYEKAIANAYKEYVLSSQNQERVPLLIPEFRYLGVARDHVYRLDFMVINPYTQSRVGFELSPWSTHGKLTGTKDKLQKEINAEASANFEKEMKKHRSYFKEHDVTVLIYTDSNLADCNKIFNEDISPLLEVTPTIKPMDFISFSKLFST